MSKVAHKNAVKHAAKHSVKQALKQKFSAAQPAGKAAAPCPLKCNLKLLKISEPEAGTKEKKLARAAEIRALVKLDRKASPTLIPSGGRFQITANSKLAKEPRELKYSAVTEATCPGTKHPVLTWTDSTGSKTLVGTGGEAKFYRQDLSCDHNVGFFTFLNAVFSTHATRAYSIEAQSCGNPPAANGVPASQLMAVIEVFPGDAFEAELQLPAAKKSELADHKSANWTTDRDKQGEEIKKEGEEARAGYNASSAKSRAAWGSEAEYEKAFKDKKKEELDYKDREPEGLKVKLTQKDGSRSVEAKVEEIIDLYKLARSTEARIKKIQEWIEDIQIGPGASFKAEIEVLVVSLKAEWGYREYTDDRVFMAVTGSVSIEVIKGSIEAFFGFRSAGLANVLAFVKGEGALKVTGAIKHEEPDSPFTADVKPAGEFKLSGGVQGQAMWVVTAEGKLESGFSLEMSKISIFQKDAMLKGELEIKLIPVQTILTISCKFVGSRKRAFELTKERKWTIPIGEAEAGK